MPSNLIEAARTDARRPWRAIGAEVGVKREKRGPDAGDQRRQRAFIRELCRGGAWVAGTMLGEDIRETLLGVVQVEL